MCVVHLGSGTYQYSSNHIGFILQTVEFLHYWNVDYSVDIFLVLVPVTDLCTPKQQRQRQQSMVHTVPASEGSREYHGGG
jgi:ABC-type lipoprotein export system ATPase subunit